MSFGRKLELNFSNTNSIPLLEETVNNRLNSIQEKVFQLNKIYEEVKNFCGKLNGMAMKEYASSKPNIYNKISDFPNILKEVQDTIVNIRSFQFKDSKVESSVRDKIRIIEERIISLNQDFRKNVDILVDREKMFFNDYKAESERNSLASLKDPEKFNESQIILQTVINNKEYMEQRERELAEIKKISGQILSQTEAMSADVQKQKEQLGSIEDNVIEVNMNAKLAEREIQDAEKMTRRSGRKILWFSLLLLFVIISIIIIVVLLLVPRNDN